MGSRLTCLHHLLLAAACWVQEAERPAQPSSPRLYLAVEGFRRCPVGNEGTGIRIGGDVIRHGFALRTDPCPQSINSPERTAHLHDASSPALTTWSNEPTLNAIPRNGSTSSQAIPLGSTEEE